jgi:hypothetical protein
MTLLSGPKPRKGGLKMSAPDYFWKAFEATGSPQLYLLYKNNDKLRSDNERNKRQAGL